MLIVTQIGKDETKVFLFADDIILCIKDSKPPSENSGCW